MKSFRDDANAIVEESIRAVLPDAAVRRALEDFDRPEGRLILVAAGKAAWQMAKAAVEYFESLEERADDADGLTVRPVIDDGIVITKYGHVKGMIPRVRCLEAGHPVPDENGFAATAAAVETVKDLTEKDAVLFLLSGGGSALFEMPLIPGAQLQDITDPEQRKQLSRLMNDLFAEAKKLMDEVKAQRGWEASVERELNSLGVND